MARVSDAGMAMIQAFEGCELVAYQDTGGIWTIGYGHTGADVYQGRAISQEEAETLFRADLQRFERGVENALKRPATQEQFDSMVSFALNVGLGAFRSSTLLERFNAGDDAGAALEFERWTKDGSGKELPGLIRRRGIESALYRTGA